jgi:hypothetical protein
VTDNHNPTFNILIALAVFFCWWIFLEKEKIKKTSSLKFQVMSCIYNFNLKQKTKLWIHSSTPTYFPSISHFVAMSQADGILFEIEDNFQNKRTAIALISIVLTEFCYWTFLSNTLKPITKEPKIFK